MKASVDHRNRAKPGDRVWVYSPLRGRGRFTLVRVKEVGRRSITVDGWGKYDIKTGQRHRDSWSGWLGGELDFQLRKYHDARFQIAQLVRDAVDPYKIWEIAKVLGFEPEAPEMEAEVDDDA